MKTVALVGGLLLAALTVFGIFGAARFARLAAGIEARLLGGAAPVNVAGSLPAAVREFALRADATPTDLARAVRFTQRAEMLLKPGRPWQPLDATQLIAVGEPGFLWQARQAFGPLPKVQVVDAFRGGRGLLRVRLFGLLRVANAEGPAIDRGEALRYLAELPWAPDAILGNPAIAWRERDDGWVEATLDAGGAPVSVRFRFDAAGDIVEVRADARETTDDDGNPAAYPWQGYFRDYRMVGPRRIPAEGEVGYVRPGGYRAYWQGQITGYGAIH